MATENPERNDPSSTSALALLTIGRHPALPVRILGATSAALLIATVAHSYLSRFNVPAGSDPLTSWWATLRDPLALLRVAALVMAMVLGMIAQAMLSVRRKGSQPAPTWSRQSIREAVSSRGFAKSLLLSPMVFYSVYVGVQTQPDDILALIFAFQNGFFWKAVLGQK